MSKLPDGPGANLLAMLRFGRAPGEFFRAAAARYGDTYRFFIPGFGHTLVISQPEHIAEMFQADREHLEWGDNNLLEPIMGSSSLLVLEGARHKRHRQLLTPPFHGERMRTYGTLMRELAVREISKWQVGDHVVAQAFGQTVTMNVVLRTVFGVADGARLDEIRVLVTGMLDSAGPLVLFAKPLRIDLGPLTPWGRFKRAMRRVDEILFREIRARRDVDLTDRDDVLSLLLGARDEDGEGMSDQEIRDELVTLLIAGHETTATAIAWAIHWLCENPDVRQRLLDELRVVPPDATPEQIAQLPYLTAVCSETLRIEPVLPDTMRIVRSAVRIAEVDLEEGTYIMPAIWAVHHRPELYEEPFAFRPERFLDRKYSPYEYLPFGGGVHKCIGWAFALYEMKMVLFEVLQRAQLRSVDGTRVKAVRRNLSVGPSGGVDVVVESLTS